MFVSLIKIIIGLFIFKLLPYLIYKKRKFNKYTLSFYIYIFIKFVGLLIIIFSLFDLLIKYL